MTISDVRCPNYHYLGQRIGNTLIVSDGLEIEFKRSANVKCPDCRLTTRFGVERNGRNKVLHNSEK
jgi:hypothetical protein